MKNDLATNPVVSREELGGATLITLSLGALLGAGFIPTSSDFWDLLIKQMSITSPDVIKIGRDLAFPVLAFLFYRSMAKRSGPPGLIAPQWDILKISFLPLAIAMAFGLFRGGPNAISRLMHPPPVEIWLWFLVCVPLGEELLFRGWIYGLLERVYGAKWLTSTNPLPLALVMSSIAFSLWHLQNWAFLGPGPTLFQVSYTFFTGLWLGVLRWKTKGMWAPILGHIAINALAG